MLCKTLDEGRSLTVIGKLSEITEEQAKELVEGADYYLSFKNYTNKGTLDPLGSLYSAARETGITDLEHDQYLVIKL